MAHIEVPNIGLVSVIFWDGSFREHFDAIACVQDQTLPRDRYEVIFVEYFERVNPEVQAMAERCDNMQTVALGNSHDGKQNQHIIGVCVNEGLRRARGDLIVVPDADVVFGQDFLEEIVREHERIEDLALYFYRMDEPETGSPVARTLPELARVGRLVNAENYGGCLTVRKKWLEAVNGYEEHPVARGYSAAGRDTAMRLRTLGLALKWHPRLFVYHGYHPGSRDPDPESARRMQRHTRGVVERAKALETLPGRGLDPARPGREDFYDLPPGGQAGLPGGRRHWANRLVRRLLPARLRRFLTRVLRD